MNLIDLFSYLNIENTEINVNLIRSVPLPPWVRDTEAMTWFALYA